MMEISVRLLESDKDLAKVELSYTIGERGHKKKVVLVPWIMAPGNKQTHMTGV